MHQYNFDYLTTSEQKKLCGPPEISDAPLRVVMSQTWHISVKMALLFVFAVQEMSEIMYVVKIKIKKTNTNKTHRKYIIKNSKSTTIELQITFSSLQLRIIQNK